METVPAALAGWESYYVIVGSSAAALTGLQFVVIALVAEVMRRGNPDQIDAFATPTVVHFALALLVSATLSAPWHTLVSPGVVLGITGLAGFLYAVIVIRRARTQRGYEPVFEDWLWHACLPLVAYGLIIGGSVALVRHPEPALFAIGAATLLLVFIGIHNAWDTVTYITFTRLEPAEGAVPADATRGDGPARATDARPAGETESTSA